MNISQLTTNLNNHQSLSDNPNANEGLTATELKVLFDKAPNDIKTYINTVLIPALNSGTADSGANTNITSMSGITGGIATADYIDIDQTPTAGQAVGRLRWSATDGTLEVGLVGGNVNLQIGQEEVLRVLNNTGNAMTEGQVVYITGASGQRPTVALALGTSDTTSARTIGVLTENIANNAQGFVTMSGIVNNVNTSAFAEGSALWLSATTAGAITTTRPSAPNHGVLVGFCVRSHATQGQILVKVQNGFELDELHDVLINAVANNNLLAYDSASGVWKNKSYAELGLATQTYVDNAVANLPALSVTEGEIANLAITNGKIAYNTITSDKLVTGTLDSRYYTETEIDTNIYTKTQVQTSGQALIHWDNVTNKPAFGDSSWKTPVATLSALPASGNTNGDLRLVLDTDLVYTWDSPTSAWKLIGASGSGVTSHSSLTNLNSDDHLQYLRTDGTRALTGDIDFAKYEGKNFVVHNSSTAPNTPDIGQLWYDVPNNQLKVYKGVSLGWVDVSGQGAVILDKEFTATAGQTAFDLSSVGQYAPGTNALSVFINGVLQSETAYTETSTTVVTLNIGATAGQKVYIKWFYQDPAVLSTFAPKNNPTFTGTVTVPTPSASTSAATKDYVDVAVAFKAPLENPTFFGNVTVPTPTLSTDATTKDYVDTQDALKAPIASPTFTGTVTSPITNITDTLKIDEVKETVNVFASAPVTNTDLKSGAVFYYTSNTSANFTLNFRGDASTTLNTLMSVGQSMTVTVLVTNGTTAYYANVIQIDGTTVTPKWSGGTAPTAGNASAIDIYTFTIIKTAANTYTVLGSQSKYA